MLYATEAVILSASNMRQLDNCLNKAVHGIFGVGTSDNLRCVRNAFGLPNIRVIIEIIRRKFMDGLIDAGAYSPID